MYTICKSKIFASLLALLLITACSPRISISVEQPTATAQPGAIAQPTATAQPSAASPAPGTRAVQSAEFGISLSYAETLARTALVQQVAPVPFSPNSIYGSHPGYVSVTFGGYALNRPFQLPDPLTAPQVMVYHTADFSAYGTQSPNDWPTQQAKLADLLKTGIDPQRCAAPLISEEVRLPYLPWTNAAQVFCAQAKTLEFGSGSGSRPGRGIRYLTAYAQGPAPLVDERIFYTFQGLTDDGQVYISAVFPVETGVFPVGTPQPLTDLTIMHNLLVDQVTRLNGQAPANFHPSLEALDAVIESIDLK